MKTVRIVGIGMGADTVTAQGLRAIEEAHLLIGAKRMLESFAYLEKTMVEEYAPQQVADTVQASGDSCFAVLVSGDVGFFSAAQSLVNVLDFCKVELIAGISSLNYFFARLQRPWQETAMVSCHGRECNLADTVRRNHLTFALTGGNIEALSERLEQAGYKDLNVFVGEDLGMDTERILCCRVSQLPSKKIGPLAVLLIENPNASAQTPVGIPDEHFLRGEVPMTKAEVRAVIMSKLALSPESVCVDIGAGTGSVTVEMALSAWNGRVYAVEQKAEGIDLIQENCRSFHIGNVEPILGSAPAALEELPPVDAAFIGGSGGKMQEIVSTLVSQNPAVRIVISAIAVESVSAALNALKEAGIAPEVVQISVSRGKEAGGLHLMMAQNPIFIISGGGSDGR